MNSLENLKNIQKRMAKCMRSPGSEIPSWDQIKEDLQAFQQIRKPLWNAQEGISPEEKEQILEAVIEFLDACVEKGRAI